MNYSDQDTKWNFIEGVSEWGDKIKRTTENQRDAWAWRKVKKLVLEDGRTFK